MAANKQEVELIIRAREVGTKTFKATADQIKGLNKVLGEQVEAASRGETSAAALTATMKKLENAGAQLIKQQALIDFHQRLATQLGEAEAKAQAAAAAHRELATAQEAAETTTRAEEKQLRALLKASEGAQKRVDSLTASLAAQDSKLEAAGLATGDLAETQARLVAAAQEVGVALTQAGNLVDGYEEHLRKLKATQDRVAADASFERTIAEARQLRQAADYVGFWTQSLEKAERQERELAEVEGFRKKIAEARQLREATEYVDFWTQALDRAEAQERQLAELNAFRKIGDDAQATAAQIGTLNTATTKGAASGSKFAASLQAMIDPAGAARATLSGLEAEIERITVEVGDGTKQVREYQEAFNDLGRVQAGLLRQAGAIDAFKDQEVAVKNAEEALGRHRTQMVLNAQAVQAALVPNERLTQELRESEVATEAAARALDNEVAKLNKLRGPLEAAGINTAELANEQARLAAVSQRTATAVNKLDGAMKGQNSRAGRFLGLRPYELQNLSYQLNDVFTQLASGTSITQTFAQQSGQFAQIPGVLSAVVRFLPQLAALVVVLGSTYAAIKRITDLQASVRGFTKELAASADGALYNAKALADTARALEDTGVSAKDARAAVSAFVKEGLDPELIDEFTMAARAMSKVTGDDIPTAAAKMAQAFDAGYDAIAKLDDELNFLTAAEREQIRAMFDAGRAADAQRFAFDRLQKKMAEGATAAKGPWTDAIKSLSSAWREFLDWLGGTNVIQQTINEIKALADGASWLASQLPGAQGRNGPSTLANGQRAAGGGGLPGGVRRVPEWQVRTNWGDSMVRGQPTGPYTDQNRQVGNAIGGFLGGGLRSNSTKVQVTPEIRDIIATVMLEAINDPAAQRDVAAVILNRMERSGQSGSQVVRAPGQFQPVSDPRSRQRWAQITEDTEGFAAALANVLPILEGAQADPTNGATLFYSPRGMQDNMQRGIASNLTPNWATPETFVGERAGHRFYNGAFPGDRRQTRTPNQADDKAGSDYLRELTEIRAQTQQVTDAERIRTAGLEAQREAQNRGANESAQAAAKAYAEETERFKVDRERTAERLALAGEIQSSFSAAAGAQDQSLSQRLEAITRQYDILFAKIQEGRDRGVGDVGGRTLDQLEAQARLDMQALKNRETMAFYEERLASTERERTELLGQINSEMENGAISAQVAVERTQAVNARFVPILKTISDEAVAFATALQSAEPSPRLEAFIARLQSAPADAVAGANRAALKIYEDALKSLVQARDEAISGVLDQLDQRAITTTEALAEAQRIQDELNPGIAQMARDAEAFAASISGTTPSPALQSFIAEMRQIGTRATQTGGTNPRTNAVANVGLAGLAQEEDKLNTIIARRNEQAALYNELVERRVLTESEARAATQALYSETQPLIDQQLAGMRGLLDTLVRLGIITPQVYDLWLVKMQAVGAGADYLDEKVRGIQQQLESTFANGITDTFITGIDSLVEGTDAWNQRIAEGKSALEATWDTFRTFASDFLAQIAQMIIQQMILNALQNAAGQGGGTGGGWFGSLARMIVGTKHSGGLGGSKGVKRSGESPLAWLNVPRYHKGRNPLGLSADEERAIILKNEEVLTEDNPRHIKNFMGGSGGPSIPPQIALKIVNAMNAGTLSSEMLESKEGTENFLNWFSTHSRAIKARIG